MSSRKSGRSYFSGPIPNKDGTKPSEFVSAVTKSSGVRARSQQFEAATLPGRMQISAFLAKREHNLNRLPIPVFDKKRVKLATKIEGDRDYYNATYADVNREDYIIAQAPNQDTVGKFWKMVWSDSCKLVVCVIDKASFSNTDAKLSYNFFPRDDKPIQKNRYTIKLISRTERKGFFIYELELTTTDEDVKRKNVKQDDTIEAKTRTVTLMHFENWRIDSWPDVDHLAGYSNAINLRAVDIIKKITDDYIPPIVIVSLNGLHRASSIWVCVVLAKLIETKDNFDVDALMRTLVKFRPGAFTNKLQFYVTYAVGLRMSATGGWMVTEDSRERIKQIREGAKGLCK